MNTSATESSSLPAKPLSPSATLTRSAPWWMLVSRSLLFLFFQAIIALLLAATGTASGWLASAKWWLLCVILANLASIYLLTILFRREGKRYRDLFRFSRPTLKLDLVWLVGVLIIGTPIMAAPMTFLAGAIFGDPSVPNATMFQPLPPWALAVGILFPLTIALAELPTYFGYAMPRLAAQLKSGWLAWLLASFFLAAQHMFLPFVPDGRFILWRLGMFLPFALFTGLVLKFRPTLLPYFVILHALMDLSTLAVYFMV